MDETEREPSRADRPTDVVERDARRMQRLGQANAGEGVGLVAPTLSSSLQDAEVGQEPYLFDVRPGPRREFSFRKTAHRLASSQAGEVHRFVTPFMRPSFKADGKLMER